LAQSESNNIIDKERVKEFSRKINGNNLVIDSAIFYIAWPDSNVNKNSKFKYKYDSDGRLILVEEDNWDNYAQGLFGWGKQNKNKTIYSYNPNGKLLKQHDLEWHTSQSGWHNLYIKNFIYDGAGNIILDSAEYYQDNVIYLIIRKQYSYDENNNKIEEVLEEFLNGNLNSKFKRSFEYDNYDREIVFIRQKYENESWTNLLKIKSRYDHFGNRIEWLWQDWKNDWVNEWRHYLEVNEDNSFVVRFEEEWLNDKWNYLYKRDYQRSQAGKTTSLIYYIWSDSIWVNDEKYKLIYDIRNNILSNSKELWENNNWKYDYKNTYLYTMFDQPIEERTYNWGNSQWVNNRLTVYSYDENSNPVLGEQLKWSNDSWTRYDANLVLNFPSNEQMWFSFGTKIEVFYSNHLVNEVGPLHGAHEFTLSQNYPNPFNPETIISYSIPKLTKVKIVLFDILGNEVKIIEDSNKLPGNYSVNFNADQFTSGVYFYRLITENYIETKKMLLLK